MCSPEPRWFQALRSNLELLPKTSLQLLTYTQHQNQCSSTWHSLLLTRLCRSPNVQIIEHIVEIPEIPSAESAQTFVSLGTAPVRRRLVVKAPVVEHGAMVLEDRADGAGPGPWASGFVYAEPVPPAVVANNQAQINDEVVENPQIPRAQECLYYREFGKCSP